MTHEKFVETVHRLEDFARREPGRYQFRVALLAALGYAYPLLIIGVILALVGGAVYLMFVGGRFHVAALKVVLLLGGFALFVARSLWVKVEPPDGEEVTREEAPRLFALADELTAALKTPRIDHVLVNGEFNAALAQVPRLGPLGFYRNYMVVGLPLAHALTPEQFRAVVAHEVGHMSGRQGRFFEWIYRVRQTWAELLERFEREQRRGAWLFEWFVKLYAPFFNAYSFVLARRHEYE
ncbi:MAG TPA: M48 family metallopeptidase, partial [Pyrinomonadaceae bacterium]|nr:M48 family metallopeptidase [Pyrinomonadaceae bacterium]